MPSHRMPARRRSAHRIVGRTVGLGATAVLAAALLAWTPGVATGWNQSSAEATLWQLMNGARVNNGLRPVQQNSTLVSLARWRSKDEVQRDYFSHDVKGTPYQVYHWYDLNGLRYRYGGENIGWNNGYADGDSPVAIHNGFMNSPGHRANILNGDWTHGGVGAFAADNVSFLGQTRSPRFYTELFMQSVSSAPAPPPPAPAPASHSAPAPPSGGGGGGGTSASAATTATPRRKASEISLAAPSRPRATLPLDGAAPILANGGRLVAASKLAQLAFVDNWQLQPPDSPQLLASTGQMQGGYRVEGGAAPAAGFFESVLGSLLGDLLG